jgi:hypothetical protein
LIRYILPALLVAVPSFAQQVDPRLAGPMVQALQSQIALQAAVIKAKDEDQQKKDADLAEWFKGWFGEKPVAEAK